MGQRLATCCGGIHIRSGSTERQGCARPITSNCHRERSIAQAHRRSTASRTTVARPRLIQYRTENLRVVPVFGKGALEVSPRIGHVHVTVDDAGWHFVDASGETLIVVGLKPGPHKVLIELADPTHRVITSETVKFTLPGPKFPDSR
jgi:hypothetical protein